MSKYAFGKAVALTQDQAIQAVTQALAKEGFGVLTEIEPQIGALLPCNVVVRQGADGRTVVEFMDPDAVLGLVGRPEIAPIAAQVRSRLERVLQSL
jgi:uncharacterized protein (DUF302 family)